MEKCSFHTRVQMSFSSSDFEGKRIAVFFKEANNASGCLSHTMQQPFLKYKLLRFMNTHTHTHTERLFCRGGGCSDVECVRACVCVCVRERASRGVRPKLCSLLGERGPVWIRYRSDDGEVKGLWVFWGMSRRHGRAAFSHAHTGKCSGCRGIRGKCYRMRGGRESAGKNVGL